MGLNNSFSSLGRIAGPIWAGFIFEVKVQYSYLSGSVIMFIGFLSVWSGFHKVEKKPPA